MQQAILYPEEMGTIGSRARQRREELGLSLPALAERLKQVTGTKVTWQSLQQLETSDAGGTKHLVPLARALDVSVDWLYDESAPPVSAKRESLLVGKVGAGAEVIPFEEGAVLEGIDPPPGIAAPNAAVIVGDSQYPLQDGWIVFYGREHDGISESAIGKLSIVQIKDGPKLLKTLKRGPRKGLWRLESWNAPPIEGVKIDWAAKVEDIRPR